jgi:hypothetical protein
VARTPHPAACAACVPVGSPPFACALAELFETYSASGVSLADGEVLNIVPYLINSAFGDSKPRIRTQIHQARTGRTRARGPQ